MKNILILVTLLYSFTVSSQSFDKIKLSDKEIPSGYQLTEESQCISIQACTFYKNPGMYSALIGKVKSKDIQNFENGKDSGSIMYFEMEKDFVMTGFLEGLFWGEKQATQEHPEQILVKGKILIVYSFPLKSPVIDISKKKVEAELK